MEIRKQKGKQVGRLTVMEQQYQEDLQRLRYHSSVMDIENLHLGQEFKELPDTYTIFIIEILN